MRLLCRFSLARVAIALALCGSMFLTGCSSSQLDRAAKASKSLAQYTGETIVIVKGLFETGAISVEVKDKFADQLIVLSKTGAVFNQLVKTLSDQYKTGTVPASSWAQLTALFDQLTKTFLGILDLIPQAAGLKDSKAFKLLTAAVLAIAQVLMQSSGYFPKMQRQEARSFYPKLTAKVARLGVGLTTQREVLSGLE